MPHNESVQLEQVKHDVYKQVVVLILGEYGFDYKEGKLIVNGTDVWHMSGPAADTGITGRKIIVDTYGGYDRMGAVLSLVKIRHK